MRFRPKGADDEMRVELTSMTDIIFLLLIFFMISTTFEGTRKSLEYPAAGKQSRRSGTGSAAAYY